MSLRSRDTTDWLLLAGFCGFLFFFGLSFFGLVGADEPRYAQVAREMLTRHDWITPTLGGRAWLEKPPLYYWQAILTFRLFGVSDWAARLPSAFDATIMVVAVYVFLRRLRPGFHLDGALITASAAGVIAFARAASTDMPLTAMFTIAMLAWYAWYETSSRPCLALFHFFLGLAVLAKGPVALLFAVLIVAIFAAFKKQWSLMGRTMWLPGIFLFFAVSLPWYVTAQIRNPEFFREFILRQNFARFGSPLYHHVEPFWYYGPLALLGLLPWTIYIAAAVTENVKTWWAGKGKHPVDEDALRSFLIIWFLAPIAFFSLSQSKLPGYILPALPAATLLLAAYVRQHALGSSVQPMLRIALHSAVASALMVPGLMVQYIVLQHRIPWGKACAISLALAGILAIGIAITLRSALGLRMLRFVTLVPVILSISAVLRIGAPSLDSMLSARPLANQLRSLAISPLPIAVLNVSRETQFGLAFYCSQPIDRYEFGQVPAGEHLLVAREGLQAQITTGVHGARVSYLGSFAPQGLDYYLVSPRTH